MSHTPLILSERQASTDSQQLPSFTSVKSSHMEMQPPFPRHPPLCSLPIFFTLLLEPVQGLALGAGGSWQVGR